MFCKYCGKEIDSSDRFCDGCGANLQETIISQATETSKVFNDGKSYLRSFFSKNPVTVIDKSKNVSSWIGVGLVIFAIFLYSLVTCLNITQISNVVLSSVNDTVNSTAQEILGDFGNQIGGYLPHLEISFLIELFVPYFFLAVVVIGVVFAVLYLSLRVRKMSIPDLKSSFNMLGATNLPIITVLMVNLILGFVLPQATIFIFAVGVFVSAIFVYEMLRSFYGDDYKPIIEMLIIAVAVLLASAIFITITVNIIGNELENTLVSELDRMVDDGTNLMNDFLGSIF